MISEIKVRTIKLQKKKNNRNQQQQKIVEKKNSRVLKSLSIFIDCCCCLHPHTIIINIKCLHRIVVQIYICLLLLFILLLLFLIAKGKKRKIFMSTQENSIEALGMIFGSDNTNEIWKLISVFIYFFTFSF